MSKQAPKIAILGAGTFVKTQYIPRLAEISDLLHVKAIWSRTQASAESAVEIARKCFPTVEFKWGEAGLDDIIQDDSILGVAVVLAGQAQGLMVCPVTLVEVHENWPRQSQVDMSLRLLKAGKHVLQEKPAAASTSELEYALTNYNSVSANCLGQPLWAVAENYRFEPAFVESKNLIADIGDMMSVQVIVEGSMNSSNPYFSSSWRRDFTGGFILDMGVHFIAGLRMLVGCEVVSVSASTSYVDKTLPPPDNISSIFQLENGCSGVFVMVVSSRSPKIFWRVVGLKGTLQIERGNQDGKHGYLVSFSDANGLNKSSFYPFSGVTEELKTFIDAISAKGSDYKADARISFVEGARDVAVLEAMLESGAKNGAVVQVKRF